MQIQSKLIAVLLLSSTVLFGCGGGDPPITERSDTGGGGGGGNGGGGDGGGGGGSTAQGISYLPLDVFEAYKDFSGFEDDGRFQGYGQFPLSPMYLINPVDAATLQSVTTATSSDYTVTVDGTTIDDSESFPLLQKVVGSQASLRTALIFDLSSSLSHIDIEALIAEAKAYVVASQAHSNSTIRSQEFVVWAFGTEILEVTTGATRDSVEINTALDEVVVLYNSQFLGPSSNLHRAVVEAIGRFKGTENTIAYNFRDSETLDDNDLIDSANADGVNLSQLVLFSSGPDTALSFSQTLMNKAIESQAFLQYDETAVASSNTMKTLKKPVFYYVVGAGAAGVVYPALSSQAERTTSIRLIEGAYSFSDGLILNQLAAINDRIDLNNQYVYRFAFLPRTGDHTTIFSSNSIGHSYSLTTDFKHADIDGLPDAGPSVEIAGSSGEFIADNEIRLSEMDTFSPATRWSNDVFGPGDYSWVLSGGTGALNVDGTYTVTSISGAQATLTLTNDILVSGAVSAEIVISNN